MIFDLVCLRRSSIVRSGGSASEDGPLDMRMDQREGRTAADLVRDLPETELADVIYQLGEERYREESLVTIVQARMRVRFCTTGKLAAVVGAGGARLISAWTIHCATRTFQALRIAVNRKLDIA